MGFFPRGCLLFSTLSRSFWNVWPRRFSFLKTSGIFAAMNTRSDTLGSLPDKDVRRGERFISETFCSCQHLMGAEDETAAQTVFFPQPPPQNLAPPTFDFIEPRPFGTLHKNTVSTPSFPLSPTLSPSGNLICFFWPPRAIVLF